MDIKEIRNRLRQGKPVRDPPTKEKLTKEDLRNLFDSRRMKEYVEGLKWSDDFEKEDLTFLGDNPNLEFYHKIKEDILKDKVKVKYDEDNDQITYFWND